MVYSLLFSIMKIAQNTQTLKGSVLHMTRKTKMNYTVTEEKMARVNEENKELLEDFLDFCQSVDRSEGTIKNYKSDLRICFVWCLENAKNKPFTDFTKRDFMKYQKYLINDLELSSSRVRRLRSSMSSLSNFIENILDDDYPDFRNIVNKIDAPVNVPVRKKTILSDDQVQELLDKLVAEKEYQQACVFALAWGSGSRLSELLRFKTWYFTDENIMFGSLYKTPEEIKTKGRGSQGKPLHRYVLVNKFKPYFELWVQERERLGIDCEELFVIKREDGWGKMKKHTLNTYSKKFSELLGVSFYFHCMRHNFTTGLAQANIPADIIKDIVGWESVDMVSLYNDIKIDDKLGEYFGAGGVKQVEVKSLGDL